LKFEAPTPEAQKLFLDSFNETKQRYATELAALSAGRLTLPNTDFDTGESAVYGEYSLADETYAELLKRLEKTTFTSVDTALRQHIVAFYRPAPAAVLAGRNEQKRDREIRRQLTLLNAIVP
jgi:hypothetical protein